MLKNLTNKKIYNIAKEYKIKYDNLIHYPFKGWCNDYPQLLFFKNKKVVYRYNIYISEDPLSILPYEIYLPYKEKREAIDLINFDGNKEYLIQKYAKDFIFDYDIGIPILRSWGEYELINYLSQFYFFANVPIEYEEWLDIDGYFGTKNIKKSYKK